MSQAGGRGRAVGAARSVVPVLAELAQSTPALARSPSLSPAELRVREQSQPAQRVVLEAATLGQLGQETLAGLAAHTTRVYHEASGGMLRRRDQARGEEHQAIMSRFTELMLGELASDLVHNQRQISAQIKRASATELQPPALPPEPRSATVELRRLTLAERLTGKALIVHD